MEELFEMLGSEEALQAFSEMMGGVGAVMSTACLLSPSAGIFQILGWLLCLWCSCGCWAASPMTIR